MSTAELYKCNNKNILLSKSFATFIFSYKFNSMKSVMTIIFLS